MSNTCECGCGQVPPPAPRTREARGEVKGEPRRYVPGHNPNHNITGAHAPKTAAVKTVRPVPRVTREALLRSLEPPNLCKVAAFLDRLDPDSRDVVEEALGYSANDYPASALRNLLVSSGFADGDVPSNGSIQDHRNGRRPCRCKG